MLQALHGCCERAVKAAVIPGSGLEWTRHYQQHVESDRSCLNEWEALNELESVRKDSEGYRWVECQSSDPQSLLRSAVCRLCRYDFKRREQLHRSFNFV